MTFAIDPHLPAAGLTQASGVATQGGALNISMVFNLSAPTQQTWFHEFQHALIEISKALVRSAGTAPSGSAGAAGIKAAMTSSRTATRYFTDLAFANVQPESQAVITDYKTIVGAARQAAQGKTLNALSDSAVLEHVVNERRAKLEENAFVTANKRGAPSSSTLPHYLYDELVVPIKAQLSPAEQTTFNASVTKLQLSANLEASLQTLLQKL